MFRAAAAKKMRYSACDNHQRIVGGRSDLLLFIFTTRCERGGVSVFHARPAQKKHVVLGNTANTSKGGCRQAYDLLTWHLKKSNYTNQVDLVA